MNLLEIVKIVASLFNLLFGVYAIWQPEVIARASHYTLNNARGRVEARVVTGGVFVGLGIGAVLFGSILEQEDIAYQVVGVVALCSGATRLLGLLLEKPAGILDRSYWIYLASEVIIGVILLVPN
jgi:hypothetical protein